MAIFHSTVIFTICLLNSNYGMKGEKFTFNFVSLDDLFAQNYCFSLRIGGVWKCNKRILMLVA